MSSHPIQLKWRFLELFLLLMIVSLGAIFVHQIGMRLDRRMAELKTEMVRTLEGRIGRKISYTSMSPSVFGYLGIRDLVIHSQDDPAEVLLRISRLKVYYDFFRFLYTRAVVLSLKEIQIANSYFDIDYNRDRELLELIESVLKTGAHPGRSPLSFVDRSDPRKEVYPRIDLSGNNITLR